MAHSLTQDALIRLNTTQKLPLLAVVAVRFAASWCRGRCAAAPVCIWSIWTTTCCAMWD